MTSGIPVSVWVPVLLTAALLPFGGALTVAVSGRYARVDRWWRLATGVGLVLALCGGTVCALALLDIGLGRPKPSVTQPLIALLFIILLVAGPIAVLRMPSLRQALASRAGLTLLALTHLVRVLGLVFLVLHSRDLLPAHFAYPAAWGDVLAAVLAPAAAWAVWFHYPEVLRPGSPWRKGVIAFNVIGLLDHAYAIGSGLATAPGIWQLIHTTPTTAVFAGLPMVLFPVFLVPYADLLHVIMLMLVLRPHAADAGRAS
ncbi:hypothetical protein [Smaragdicoccus niigatensis]|uniref:hypothetical protein n=1 Tax=Smaragdicoccus niigatensis TaxID=359359 RepID=UPI00037543CE|nr:hypothetical protein [Smaragdicoccus niigatensis]